MCGVDDGFVLLLMLLFLALFYGYENMFVSISSHNWTINQGIVEMITTLIITPPITTARTTTTPYKTGGEKRHPFPVSETWRAAPQSFHSARLASPLHLPPIDYLTTSQRSTSLPVASGLARHMDADLRHRPFRVLRDKGKGRGEGLKEGGI